MAFTDVLHVKTAIEKWLNGEHIFDVKSLKENKRGECRLKCRRIYSSVLLLLCQPDVLREISSVLHGQLAL